MAIHVREEQHFALELTPLIDVVFLLLVFFLVATTFHQLEREMTVSVPNSDTSDPLKDVPDPVVVNLLADGRIVVGGSTFDTHQLESYLRRSAERLSQVKALIRADKSVSVELLVLVADACRKARATISLATTDNEQHK